MILIKYKKTRRIIKLYLNTELIIIILFVVIIESSMIKFKETRYNTLYKDLENIDSKIFVTGDISNHKYGTSFTGKIIEEKNNNNLKNTKLKFMTNKKINLNYGDILEVKGILKEVKKVDNKGVFNYKKYLKMKGIYKQVEVTSLKKKEETKNIYQIFKNLNKISKEKLSKNYSEKSASYLIAILLGDKEKLSEESKLNFKEGGISHILAISGMHIGIIIFISETVIKKISINNRRQKIILILILIIYGLLVDMSPSVYRSIIISIMHLTAKMIYKKDNFFVNISLASIIILLINPYYLIDTGFLLSFIASTSIILVYNKMPKIKIKSKPINYIIEILFLSTSANILILPIIIYSFKKISISMFFTQILMIPLLYIIEIFGILSLILPSKLLIFKEFLEKIIMLFDLLSKIHFFSIYLKVPKFIQIMIYYIAVILIISKRKIVNKFLRRFLTILIIINFTFKIIFPIIDKTLYINMIDVGQGDSTLIITTNKTKILIDGGDDGENILIPYLLSKQIKKIDYIIISHFDSDHILRNNKHNRKFTSKKYYYWNAI